VVPTTSRPPRPSTGRAVASQGAPLKTITLTVTITGAVGEDLEAQANERGFKVDERGEGVSLSVTADTAEGALEHLRFLSGLLASKG
jgi:hypothetical protein